MRYRYREEHEMKDSGVKWIGKIPSDWEISKFKYVSELYTGNSIKDTEKDNYLDEENAYPYIATKDISIDYNTINYRNGMYTKISDKNFRIANTNSILLCIEGGSAGRKISYLNHDVSFVNKLCCIKPNKIQNKFQYYYCNSDSFKKEFSLNISGLIGGVSVNALKNFLIVTPKINEQEKIANFLDKKTSQFDLIISKKEELIQRLEEAKKSLISEVVTGKVKVVKSDDGYELVKRSSEEMKDSGVEWLGKIPKDWDRIKLKHLVSTKITDGPHETPELVDEGIPFLSAEAIVDSKISIPNMRGYITKEQYEIYAKKSKVYKGDILFCKSGSTTGKSALVTTNEIFGIWSPLAIIRANEEKVYFKNLFYIIQSSYFRIQVANYWSFGTQPNIGMGTLENLYIPLSKNKEEQYCICDYLDSKVILIDSLINKIKLQIEKLKEAKQNLISEAVTGKIEVLY